MRVFLDANVLFSASHPGSAFQRLIADALDRAVVVTSDVALAEARKNLTLKRPDWLLAFEKLIAQVEAVPTTIFKLPVALASKDVPLLCSAIRAECDLFVTGDRSDFGNLFETEVLGTMIVTPLGLGQRLKESASE